MLTSLDWLVIVYMVMVAASLLSLCLMFLVRRPRMKQVAIGVAIGAVAIAAIVLERTSKGNAGKFKFARIMAAAALIIGVINTFM